MQAPKRRTSKSKRDMRRSHDHLKKPTLINCSQCGEPMPPHKVCPSCGYYKGEEVFEPKS